MPQTVRRELIANRLEFVAEITKDEKIRLVGRYRQGTQSEPRWLEFERTFAVGEAAENGYYNHAEPATIVGITGRTVTLGASGDRDGMRLTIERFAELNWNFDLDRTRRALADMGN